MKLKNKRLAFCSRHVRPRLTSWTPLTRPSGRLRPNNQLEEYKKEEDDINRICICTVRKHKDKAQKTRLLLLLIGYCVLFVDLNEIEKVT